MIVLWDKQAKINGIEAEVILNDNPALQHGEVILIMNGDTGRVEQIHSVEILRSNLKLDSTLSATQVGEAYLNHLDEEINQAKQNDVRAQMLTTLKTVEPTLDIIKNMYTLGLTNDEVYQYVVNGKITSDDYKNITGQDCSELPLDVAKQNKIKELSNVCNSTIINGFYSDADGSKKLYDFELENQVNIATKAYQVQLAQIAGQTPDNISYYAKGGECHEYTPIQFLKLAQDGEAWKTGCITKYKDLLKPKVLACTTLEEVNDITWDGDANADQTTV